MFHDIYKYDVVPVDKASNIIHTEEQNSMPHLTIYLRSKNVITASININDEDSILEDL